MSAFASQVVAYYEPLKKTFFIVKTDLGDTANDSTAVHELHHALQTSGSTSPRPEYHF